MLHPARKAPKGRGPDSASTQAEGKTTGDTWDVTNGKRTTDSLLSWAGFVLLLWPETTGAPPEPQFPHHKVGFTRTWSVRVNRLGYLCVTGSSQGSRGALASSSAPMPPPSLRPTLGPTYLMQGECPHAEGGQLDGVQQCHLDEAVGLCAPVGPVLVALDLCGARGQR